MHREVLQVLYNVLQHIGNAGHTGIQFNVLVWALIELRLTVVVVLEVIFMSENFEGALHSIKSWEVLGAFHSTRWHW